MRISLMQQWGALFIISPAYKKLDYLNVLEDENKAIGKL